MISFLLAHLLIASGSKILVCLMVYRIKFIMLSIVVVMPAKEVNPPLEWIDVARERPRISRRKIY